LLKNRVKHFAMTSGTLGLTLLGIVGCGTDPSTSTKTGIAVADTQNTTGSTPKPAVIQAVGAENEYANVISQIGGKYVNVTAVMSNPNTDPHTYEASAQTAKEISSAQLIVQNGVGYDGFMNKLESASTNTNRKVIDVQTLLGLPDNTQNPHLWYKPSTMPQVAKAIANNLSALDPAKTAYFQDNVKNFDQSLQPWISEMATVQSEFPNVPVATTEPVCDYMLQASGIDNMTPWVFQADVMNGTDPSPQDVSVEENLFKQHLVKAFLYNQQVVDSLTTSLLNLAKQNHIPVVGVYETMPSNHSYQSWMLDEVKDLQNALKNHVSTERLS